MQISREELAKIPYLDVSELGERTVLLQPFFDGQTWHQWVPGPEGTLVKLQIVDFVLGSYFAKEPASPDRDGQLLFLEFVIKRALFPDVVGFINAIENNLYNLGAALWKLDTWFDLQGPARDGSERLALTELEYIPTVCRSLFDSLQVIIARLWDRVEVDSRTKKGELPRGFANAVLKGDKPLSADGIAAKYGLPDAVAEFYAEQTDFFLRLRSFRDDLLHRGTKPFPIFRMERGFAVLAKQRPFSGLVQWDPAQLLQDNLGSVRFLAAYLVREIFRACEELTAVMTRTLRLPSDVAPGYQVFIRGYHVQQLRRIELVCAKAWERFLPQAGN